MSRLQQIESRLKGINETVFQELCDSYLALRHPSYRAFMRTGSQTGKQKTIKGTPDSFILLDNGKYLLVEATTVQRDLLKKLKEDLGKCLDEMKTGIPAESIHEVVLCFNSKLLPAELDALRNLVRAAGVYSVSFVSIDELSTQLHLQYRSLASEYLGIPLDTGQIVSMEQFTANYNDSAQSLATTLENKLLHRETEMGKLIASISGVDIVILTGPAGVGKTKLVLEAIREFQRLNPEYNTHAVLNRNFDIFDDLNLYFESEEKCILFIDDANRFDRFSQVTGYFRGAKRGSLKLVLTARDYAVHQLQSILNGLTHQVISIDGLSDKQLTDIISGDPFGIKNSQYQEKILAIADGNPRLAIMAAKIALSVQNIDALHDVSDLFDVYFTSFIRDNDLLKDKEILKALGLVSFFYTLPINDDELLDKVLSDFIVDRIHFIEAVDKLEKLELVDIHYEHVKISEQNLATYFFFKVFIKEKLLPFDRLLTLYFESHTGHFRDTVIPANNTFGYNNVRDGTRDSLRSSWERLRHYEKSAFKFLGIFWAYLFEETLEFIYTKVHQLPIPLDANYNAESEERFQGHDRDEYLKILANFLEISSDRFTDALGLSFEYVRRLPFHLPELVQTINDTVSFDIDDEPYGYYRQKKLFEFLIKKVNQKDSLFRIAFFPIAKHFLQYQFRQTRGGRNHSFTIYRYPLSVNKYTEEIRECIWRCLGSLFSDYPEECFSTLFKYSQRSPDVVKEVMEFDLDYILPLIVQHLTPGEFKHTYFVKNFNRWVKHKEIVSNELERLSGSFANISYEVYLKLSWDRFRDKEEYEFDNYKEYDALKEEEIRSSFVFTTFKDYRSFKGSFTEIIGWDELKRYNYGGSLDIVVEENLKRNEELGFLMVIDILSDPVLRTYTLYRAISHLSESQGLRKRFWDYLNPIGKEKDDVNVLWTLQFLNMLPEAELDNEYLNGLINSFKCIDSRTSIYWEPLLKYRVLDANLFERLLRVIVHKAETEKVNVDLRFDFFEKHGDLVNDLELLKKAYLQQDESQDHFDYDGQCMLAILRREPSFLKEYIANISKDTSYKRLSEYRNMSVIWDLPDYNELVNETLIAISKEFNILSKDDFSNAFFQNLKGDSVTKANTYITEFISSYNEDPDLMNTIFDVVRNSRNEIFNEAFRHYITLNPKLEAFKNISWFNSFRTYSGDVNIGDIHAAEWNTLLNLINKAPLGLDKIPLRKFVQDNIDGYKRSAENERKQRFLSKR